MIPRLQPAAAARSSYPPRPGNLLRARLEGSESLAHFDASLDAAQHSAWGALPAFTLQRAVSGSALRLLEKLENAATRGLDVRLLLDTQSPAATLPDARDALRLFLAERGSRLRTRLDRLDSDFLHHQHTWVIDAGETREHCFVGGPGFEPVAQSCWLEIAGPASSDVHHNFVQRWNEAADRDGSTHCWPDADSASPLRYPDFSCPPRGDVAVQLSRTLRPGACRDDTPPPGAKPFPLAKGEQSVLEQLVSAVAAAERTLYLESESLASPVLVEELQRALVRGVRVACLVSADPDPAFVAARRDARAAPFFEQLAELGSFEHFCLAAPLRVEAGGACAKPAVRGGVLVTDDRFACVGSARFTVRSLRGDSELNASFWHPATARSLRQGLFSRALGTGHEDLGEEASFDRFRAIARSNLDRRALWEPLQGLATALDPAQYGA